MKNSNQQMPSQKTQYRGRSSLAIVLSACACLSPVVSPLAQATIIIHDDFSVGTPSPTPNTNTWSSPWIVTSTYTNGGFAGFTRPQLDGAGNVHLNSAIGNQALYALPAFLTAPTAMVPLRSTMTVSNFVGTGISMGLDDVSGTATDAAIYLRDDNLGGGAPGNWQVYMTLNNSATFQARDTGVSLATGGTGTWEIDWSGSAVQVYFNNLLKFNSATDAPFGGGTWNIPNTAMVPVAYNYSAGDGFLSELTFETVVIPEPSTAVLVGVGGALLWRRRQRNAR